MSERITSGGVNRRSLSSRRSVLTGAACIAAAVASLLPAVAAQAASYTYSNTTSNTTPGTSWSAGTNWDAIPVSGSSTTLALNGTLGSAATIFSNNDIAANFQLNALSFTAVGPASGTAPVETINGNALEFLNNGAVGPVLTLSTTGTQKPTLTIKNGILLDDNLTVAGTTNGTLAGIVSGTAGLTKTLAGTLTLSGANTYTGATVVNGGTLAAGVASVAGVSGAFGNNSAVTIGNVSGATLNITGFNTQIGSLAGGGTTGGNVTLGAATLTVGGDGTDSNYAGGMSGTGNVTKIGAGTLSLAGATTFTGVTTVSAGVLDLKNSLSLQSSTLASGGKGLIFDASVSTNSFVLGGLSGSTDLVIANNAGSPGGIALAVGNNNSNTTYSGALSGAGSLIKVGTGNAPGTLILSGSNSYSGGTVVNSGILQFNSVAAVPASGSITVNGSSAVAFNFTGVQAVLGSRVDTSSTGTIALTSASSNENIDFSASGANLANALLGSNGSITYGGTFTPNGSVYRLGGGIGTLTYATAITGDNSLNVGGGSFSTGSPSTVLLTAGNSFTGATTISGGGLSFGTNGTTLSLGGAGGTLTGTSGIEVSGLGSLVVDDSGTNLADRVADGVAINVDSGTVALTGKASAASTETLGALTIGGGATIKVAPGTSGSAALTLASLGRGSGGSTAFSGTLLGSTNTIKFTASPTLTTGSLIPFATYSNGSTLDVASYDSTHGVIAGTYQRTSLNAAGATTDNVKVAAPETMTSSQTINALVYDGGANTTTLNLNSQTLTVSSGEVLIGRDSGVIDKGTLAFGSTEGYIYGASRSSIGPNSNVTLTGSGGVTYAGGISINAVTANYTGATEISGSLSLGNYGGWNRIPDTSAVILHDGAGLTADTRFTGSETMGSLAGSGRVYLNPTGAVPTLVSGADNTSTTFSGRWDGTFNFTKTGSGTFTYSGTGTNTGATTVNGGTMLVNGSLSGSSVTVAAGATLGGSGKTGAVSVASGGVLAPGNSPGILSTGSLALAGGATYSVDITGDGVSNPVAGTHYDQTKVAGLVNLGDGTAAGDSILSLNLDGYTPLASEQDYFIILNNGSDAVTGTFKLADGTVLAEGDTFAVNSSAFKISYVGNGDGGTIGNDVVLTTVVPEPASLGLLGLGGLLLLRRRSRKLA